MEAGKLEHIFYLEEEIAGEPYLEEMIMGSLGIFHVIKNTWHMQQMEKRNCLVIAATDHTVQRAQALGFAVCAYANPNFPGQGLYGADVLVESFEEVDLAYLDRVRRRHFKIPWDITETKRCLIREICMDDMEALFAIYEEPHMTDYMEPLYPWEEELAYEQAYIDNMYRFYEYGMWVVIEKSTGKLIGRAGLEHREYPADEDCGQTGTYDGRDTAKDIKPRVVMELEMGYAIAASYQNKGYATEACQAILAYAEEYLDYPRINCLIEKENTASIRLAEKLGFTCHGISMAAGKTMLRYVKGNC